METVAGQQWPEEILERAARIRLVLFDVDGVLTDGSLFFGDDGQEYKAFNSRDGLGMGMLQRSGVEIGIITGRSSKVVEHRMRNLGIERFSQGRHDKLEALEEIVAETGLGLEQIAYVGDDLIDLPVMRRVGLSIAVADAHPLVLDQAHWHTAAGGGRGAAREVCELVISAHGQYEQIVADYLR
jgi:3-deoxy-D-manno-octulosonate 8-phosphate phosphatase (KDO 8-P phosphatase)